jgi:hypothetical protein
VKEILLTQGKTALVDDQDYGWLNQWKWCALHYRGKCGDIWYAKRAIGTRKHHKTILMHREIAVRAGLPEVDHADANGLNNQRFNLRPCTGTQNQGNRRKQVGCSSQFKGVYWFKPTSRWRACLATKSLGYYHNEVEAALAYDAAAQKYFGQFAKLNFPTESC